tara:strand:+ start:498 stop:791 length:294 start_codon:yes stop_codon:yes gene_type:complete
MWKEEPESFFNINLSYNTRNSKKMNKLLRFLFEMTLVGLSMVFVSLFMSVLQGEDILALPHLRAMVQGVFLTGAVTHLLFEITGLNKLYVGQYTPLL